MQTILQLIKKNLFQPFGIILIATLFVVFKLLKYFTNRKIDLKSLRKKYIVNINDIKLNPIYMRAILYYLFSEGNGRTSKNVIKEKSRWNLIGKIEEFEVPDDGILYFDPPNLSFQNRIYIHIRNILNPIESMEVEFYFDREMEGLYEKVRIMILDNYSKLFSDINSRLVKKFIRVDGSWILDISVNPLMKSEYPETTLKTINYISENKERIYANGLKNLMLLGERNGSLTSYEISKRLNWNLYVISQKMSYQMLKSIIDYLPSKVVVEIKNPGIDGDKIDNLMVRNLIDNEKNKFLLIISTENRYESLYGRVPGVDVRIDQKFNF